MSTSVRAEAYWVIRPAFRPGGVVHYRRHDGALFDGNYPVVEEEPGPVYSSALFVRDAPLKAYFDFTNRCNLSCRHCITSSSPRIDTSTELPTSRILELTSELADIGVLEIAVGGGEPFIHPDWASIFHHIASSGVGLIVTTNGLRMTSAVIRVLQEVRPLEVRVSFDGGPLLHEHVRGRHTYVRAMKGLELLVEAGLRATARLTLCQGADTELAVLFSNLSDSGVRAVKVAVVKQVGRAATEAGRHLLGYLPDQRAIASLQALGEANNLEVQLSADDFPISPADANDPKLRDAERPNCGAGFETCYISARGEVLGCVTMPNLGFGQLHAASFMDVWQSRWAAAYRQRAGTSRERRLCDALCGPTCEGATAASPRGVLPILGSDTLS